MEPLVIDVNPTGPCQLRCDYCWGVDYNERGTPTNEPWLRLIQAIADAPRPAHRSAPTVLLNGGEPLLSRHHYDIATAAHAAGLSVGLSTNAIAERRLKAVLPFLDKIAIDIDGPTREVHDLLRAHSERHSGFARAIAGLLLAQEAEVPNITVRTVVDHRNMRVIPFIPGVLEAHGLDMTSIRHKLYQRTPIGPRVHNLHPDGSADGIEWKTPVSPDDTMRVAVRCAMQNPQTPLSVQLYSLSAFRYLQVRPNGDAYTVGVGTDFLPHEVELGSAFEDYGKVVDNYARQAYRQPEIGMIGGFPVGKVGDHTIPGICELLRQYVKGCSDGWYGDDLPYQAKSWMQNNGRQFAPFISELNSP